MNVNNKTLIVLILIIRFFFSVEVQAQKESLKSLTVKLEEIALKNNVIISFSPTFTNKILVPAFVEDGDVENVLINSLVNTGLIYHKISSDHYVIVRRKNIEKPPLSIVKKKEIIHVNDTPLLAKGKIMPILPTMPLQLSLLKMPESELGRIQPSLRGSDNRLFQPLSEDSSLPKWLLKTNLISNFAVTFNLGFEVGLTDKLSLDVSGSFRPWFFDNNEKWKYWIIQPELRMWMRERYNGSFFGIHSFVEIKYSDGMWLPFGFYQKRHPDCHKRAVFGAGIAYGYHLPLNKCWGMEFTLGIGNAIMRCNEHNGLSNTFKNYFGVTKLSIAVVYIIK